VHALAPFGDHVSVDVALENLASRDASQRANAVETLDTLSEPLLVRPLVPVWEPQAEPRPGGVEVLRSLLADDDPWIRACAAFAAETLEDAELRGEVEALARDDPNPAVRESARQTLRGGEVLETLPTLSLMEKVLHLGSVPLFRELSPADLKQVAETATENAYVDGTVIADQGDPGDAMHVVVSGEVRVLMGEGTGSEVARRGPGYIVGEMAVIAEQPRMASLVAVGHVRTLSIDRTRFQRILRERPDAALAVMRELVARLQEAHRSGPPAAGS
jgi:CRP/FNR family transcriptional regulator, cyclic AMP receptor protein